MPAKPEPLKPMIPAVQPQPTEPADLAGETSYTVQPGDNLTGIAQRRTEGLDVLQLIAHHNTHNSVSETDFDPQRADQNPFTPYAFGDTRRDPDLIHPGEKIYLPDEAVVAR
jgi:nucleoid-associated protein YgaU